MDIEIGAAQALLKEAIAKSKGRRPKEAQERIVRAINLLRALLPKNSKGPDGDPNDLPGENKGGGGQEQGGG